MFGRTCVVQCYIIMAWHCIAGGIWSRDRSFAVHAASDARQVPEIHDRRREQCRHLAARRRTHAERSAVLPLFACYNHRHHEYSRCLWLLQVTQCLTPSGSELQNKVSRNMTSEQSLAGHTTILLNPDRVFLILGYLSAFVFFSFFPHIFVLLLHIDCRLSWVADHTQLLFSVC